MGDAAEKLFDESLKLPPSERRTLALRVLATVREADEKAAEPAPRATTAWETIESLHGVVSLGGNALEDGERLDAPVGEETVDPLDEGEG